MLKQKLPQDDRDALLHGGGWLDTDGGKFRRGERVMVRWNKPSSDGGHACTLNTVHIGTPYAAITHIIVGSA